MENAVDHSVEKRSEREDCIVKSCFFTVPWLALQVSEKTGVHEEILIEYKSSVQSRFAHANLPGLPQISRWEPKEFKVTCRTPVSRHRTIALGFDTPIDCDMTVNAETQVYFTWS